MSALSGSHAAFTGGVAAGVMAGHGIKKYYQSRKRKGSVSHAYNGGKKMKRSYKKRKRTRYRKRQRRLAQTGQHNELMTAPVKLVLGKRKHKLLKGTAASQICVHYTKKVAGTAGRQSVDGLPALCNPNDLYRSSNPGTWSANSGQWPCDLFSANPNQKITGNALGATNGNPALDSAYLHYISGEIHFASFTSAAQELDVYFCTPKKPQAYSPGTVWYNILQQNVAGQGVAAETQPYTSGGAVTGGVYGTPSINDYGQSPFSHKTMRDSWKVLKVKKIVLDGGQQVKFKFLLHVNKFFNKQYIKTLIDSTGGAWIPHCSVNIMIIGKGSMVCDTAVTTDINEATFSAPHYGVAMNYKVSVKYPEIRRSTYQYYSDGGYYQEATLANQQLVDDTDQQKAVVRL